MMQSRLNIFLWALYDFANSLVVIVFFLYFTQWAVVDARVPDFWFNFTFTVAALMLLVTVPVVGAFLDKRWSRISGLRYTTIFTVIFYALTSYFADTGIVLWAVVFWTLGLYTYLLSFTFYTPLLNDIASEEKRGRVSGYGIAANYFGQFIGLVIAFPFASGNLSLFGGSFRAETLLPATIVFFLFSIPTLIWFKEDKKEVSNFSFKSELKYSLEETKYIFSIKPILLFFIVYFLFNDAVLTAANNFPIYMEQVWSVTDSVKSYILAGILLTSGIGGIISGQFADRVGHKRTMKYILGGWLIIFPVLAIAQNFIMFSIVTVIMGFWFGASWTVSRAMIGDLAPKNKHNLTFAYFGLVERASSFCGPLVWGGVVSGLVFLGSVRYRIALVVITFFILIALFVLSKLQTGLIEQSKNDIKA